MPSAHPVLVELESLDRLIGPESRESPIEPDGTAIAVTGGGVVALVDASQGLRSLWVGEKHLAQGPTITLDGRPLPTASGFRTGAGSWTRAFPLPGGVLVRECGLLPDVCAAAVLQWTLCKGTITGSGRADDHPRHQRLSVQLPTEPEASTARVEVSLRMDEPATLLITAPSSLTRARSLLRSLRAREDQRAERGETPVAGAFHVLVDGAPIRPLIEALHFIQDAPLSFGPDGPEGPFLAGWDATLPRFLTGGGLIEFGRAALAAGCPSLARAALQWRDDSEDPADGDLADDDLTDTWADWTGASQRLRSSEDFPGQPLSRSDPEPMLARERAPDPNSPSAPAVAGTHRDRVLKSAALIRFWVEGVLGIRPDARYGRLRLGPVWRPEWWTLDVGGIRMGDGVIRLHCHREMDTFTFHLRQEGGRVPVNLVFEPCIPASGVARVLIDGEPAEVGIENSGPGTKIHCQFPLDPERSVTIVGRP